MSFEEYQRLAAGETEAAKDKLAATRHASSSFAVSL